MGRVALRAIRAHLVRFVMSLLAVALGVSFVAGTFSLNGMLSGTFSGMVEAGMRADAYVRGGEDAVRASAVGTALGETRNLIPLDLVDAVADVDGVRAALPEITGPLVLVGADGTAVQSTQAPSFALAYHPQDPATEVVAGRAPAGIDEVALETATLASSGLAVGDTTTVVVAGELRDVDIVGEVDPGSPMAGATMVYVDAATAAADFAPDGTVTTIAVLAEDGTDPRTLVEDVTAALGGTSVPVEVLSGDDMRAEARADVEDQLGFISTFLLVFAGISLFVGAFIIANTFTMSVRQRMREFALLRAVGASPAQVLTSILLQATVVGVVGSLVGVAGGVGLVSALRVVFEGMGMDLAGDVPLDGSTVLVSVLVGTLVSVGAALLPARRAALVPPVEAMRDDVTPAERSLRVRAVVGGVLAVAGVAAVTVAALGPDGSSGEPLLGAGAVGVVIGMLLLAPVVARTVLGVLAAPFVVLLRPVGRLARGNVVRNPRRTASTAGALMIGMTLVGAATVVAATTQASLGSIVEQEAVADLIVVGANNGPVPEKAVGEIDALAQTGATDALYVGYFMTAEAGTTPGTDDVVSAAGMDPAGFGRSLDVEVVEGDLQAALRAGQAAVQERVADANGWAVGDVLTFAGGTGQRDLTVGAVFASNALGVDTAISSDLYDEMVLPTERYVTNVFVTLADGTALEDGRTAVTATLEPYVVVSLLDKDQFVAGIAAQVDQMLVILYALLGLSIVIAVLGIVNTLALSVIERTREIGLLRAVGLGRLQLSGTVAVESVLTAVFGTVLGLTVGAGLAVALQRVFTDEGLEILAVPWESLGTMLVLALVVGVLAAAGPAVRAARLPVLDAVSYE